MNFLTDLDRVQLKAQHKKERDKRICDRIKAVLLYDKGWSLSKIAEALLLTKESIHDHIVAYKNSKKLRPENGGSSEKLSFMQSNLLEIHLQNYTYLYVKDIVMYVQSTWFISYTVHGMRNWLQRHGFSYKKPAIVPGKADKQKQEAWICEYENLKKALPQDETIAFIDGVHPTHNVQPAYGWIKKGIRKEIAANSGRSRLNLSGIIDVIHYKVFVQEDKTLNGESTINFFKQIEKSYREKRKIHLFCDNAGYYRNKAVKKYLKRSKIHLHFLPPYSPNLNPIERLWKWMKERVIYNTYYPDFQQFKAAIFGFFSMLTMLSPESILGQDFRSRIRDKFRPIGAPVKNS